MVPVKKLDWISKCRSETKDCKLIGIFPLILLKPMSSLFRFLKLPMERGNVPVSDIDERLISTTVAKLAVPATLPHVTPSKEHQTG